jgi:hypothetical protein
MTSPNASTADQSMDASIPRVGAVVLVGTVIAWVTLTNLVAAQSYTFLAWNYASYFSFTFQLGWALTGGVLLALWYLRVQRGCSASRGALVGLFLIGLAVCASLAIFQTAYPTMAGDGTNGEGTIRGSAQAALFRRRFPRVYINLLADVIFKGDVYRIWQWSEGVVAAAYVALSGWVAWRFSTQIFARIGLMLYLVCTPPLISTYGHYDSYGMALLTQTLFWILLVSIDRATSTRSAIQRGIGCFVVALVAWWTHPIHVLLIAFLAYYAAARILRGRFPAAVKWWLILLGSLLLALGSSAMPLFKFPEYLLDPKVEQGYLPLEGDFLGWFIHSKLMDYLTVALPGVVLLVWQVTQGKHIPKRLKARNRDPLPLAGAAIAAILASMFSHTTIPFMQGINDEFARTAIATMLLAPAAILFYLCIPSTHRGVLFVFGVLTLFLQLPRVMVYSGDTYLDRMQSLYPHDQCGHNTKMSPYAHLGLNIPMHTEALRQRRLALFEKGITNPLPQWEKYRALNMLYLITWSYEFGDLNRARSYLAKLVQVSPETLPSVLISGAMFTHCYENKGFLTARSDIRKMLAYLSENQEQPIFQKLTAFLDRLDHQTEMNRDRYPPSTPLREQRHLNGLLPFKYSGPYLKQWQPKEEK